MSHQLEKKAQRKHFPRVGSIQQKGKLHVFLGREIQEGSRALELT